MYAPINEQTQQLNAKKCHESLDVLVAFETVQSCKPINIATTKSGHLLDNLSESKLETGEINTLC